MTTPTVYSYFVPNGHGSVTLTEDAPEWLRDAVREAHDDELPDNWRWEKCAAIVNDYEGGEHETFLLAQENMDADTATLLSWLTPSRLHWVNEAVNNYGFDNALSIIQSAQSLCLEQMATTLITAIQAHE